MGNGLDASSLGALKFLNSRINLMRKVVRGVIGNETWVSRYERCFIDTTEKALNLISTRTRLLVLKT
ncbi:hypothetical protein TSUD_136470 [Trifolium subterraneum]|uniref:Uncharacterized protein n=1 Tax=Trifolium subterraneum TaxID=3900 RepID=A0A2Z6PGW8_TRISU|nr:hypothetical protein TSUD_136470 [Trifolium subterraneum]